MIVTVLILFPPFLQRTTWRFREVNQLSQGHTASKWWRQPGCGNVVKSMISKLFLTTFNLQHCDLKQAAFPENTGLQDYREFREE